MDTLNLILESLWPMAVGAITGTIPLSIMSFVFGMIIAIGVALMRISQRRILRWTSRAFVSLIRGTPLLVQLFVVFYALPAIGLVVDPWPAATLAFSLNVGGYGAEVVRAAILSVPSGQWEAGASIGLQRGAVIRLVILPQAARVSVPPLSNTFISLVKDTSLASLILVTELFRQAEQIAAFSLEFMPIYVAAGAMYWVICLVLSVGQGALEKRLERVAV